MSGQIMTALQAFPISFEVYINLNFVHFLERYLRIKIHPRRTRSRLIPSATPMTPHPSQRPNNAEKNSLAAIVSTTDTVIVNFTSPAARSPLPSGPANGYAIPLNILFISTSLTSSAFVATEIAKKCSISGVQANTNAFHKTDKISVILSNLLK